jgi:tetratricopeptide (TPR) repeat protein
MMSRGAGENTPHTRTQPTVSLCMIVRDEEARLGRAIGSALALVDEIVVCDTGSRDNSVAVAQSLGARVVHFSWGDDFSAARNAALREVTSDWVLVLDADESLDEVDADRWRSLLEDPIAAGYEVTLVSDRGDRQEAFRLVRLFRNDPAVRYCFPVHEQIIPALNAWAAEHGLQVLPSPLVVHHSGYLPQEKAAKKPRNLRLLQKAVALHPDEPYLHFQLGAEGVSLLDDEVLPVAGMNTAAVSLERAWDLAGDFLDDEKLQRPWLGDLIGLLGSARLTAGLTGPALELLRQGVGLFPRRENLQYLFCLAALHAPGVMPGEVEDRANLLDVRRQNLVVAELRRRLDQARRHARQVLELDPEDSQGLLLAARCLRDQEMAREALGFFLRSVAASQWNWRAWREGAILMAEEGLRDQARSWRATFAEHFPDHPDHTASPAD